MNEVSVTPINDSQREAIRLFNTNDILIMTGEAGSGKTHLAMALAMRELTQQKISRIILSRPAVTAGGEKHGFLKGTLDQKMLPWLMPIHDVLRSITFKKPEDIFKEYVEVCPLAYMRGRTFSRCVAILDEAQNATYEQLVMFLTRIGPKSKLVLAGDMRQTDLRNSGLHQVVNRLWNLPGVGIVDLPSDPSTRHPIIPSLLDRL